MEQQTGDTRDTGHILSTANTSPRGLFSELSQSFGPVFVFRVFSTAISFATLALVGRALGATGLGDLSVARALMLTAAGLLGPALDTAAVRFATREPETADLYLRAILWVKSALAGLLLVVGFLAASLLRNLLFHSDPSTPVSPWLVTAALAGAGGFMLFEYVRVYFQARQRFGLYGGLDFGHALIRLVAISILLVAGWRSPLLVFVAYAAIPWVLSVVGLPLLSYSHHATRLEIWNRLREMFYFIRWVAVACALTSAANGADMLLLGWFRIGEVPRGDYSAARALAQVGDLAVLSLFSVLLPKAGTCRDANTTRSFLIRYSLPLVVGCTVCSVLLVLMSPFLRFVLRFTFGEEFTRATLCLAVLLFGTFMALWGVPASATVYSLGRSRLIAILEGLKLLIFVSVAAFLAPRYGILGMAWTTVVAKGTISLLTMACAWWTTDARRGSGGQPTEPRLAPAISE
ncbi:MAG TPA: hypothetical protein PKY35_11655 [Candidatus Hydrogenedentes bacterium]|nr:hypothetical protein [Candidatus Hydrogenedentota bacterium]HOL77672.1 hypothetical protein [Candidatus Hydrogenedentota bacterium]HPO86698.1 hypothetical protein [Candidatus Hydrogenedentota bacterium]